MNGFKWKSAVKHDVQNNTYGPNIRPFSIIETFRQNLGGHIGRSSAKTIQLSVRCTAKPKIYNFYVIRLVQEDVLKFQISVADSFLVAIYNSLHNLLHIKFGLSLRDRFSFSQNSSERLLTTILHDQ